MAKVKKIKHLIRVEEDDDTFIIIHAAEHGNTYQSFVNHAIKKEIDALRKAKDILDDRKSKKQNI